MHTDSAFDDPYVASARAAAAALAALTGQQSHATPSVGRSAEPLPPPASAWAHSAASDIPSLSHPRSLPSPALAAPRAPPDASPLAGLFSSKRPAGASAAHPPAPTSAGPSEAHRHAPCDPCPSQNQPRPIPPHIGASLSPSHRLVPRPSFSLSRHTASGLRPASTRPQFAFPKLSPAIAGGAQPQSATVGAKLDAALRDVDGALLLQSSTPRRAPHRLSRTPAAPLKAAQHYALAALRDWEGSPWPALLSRVLRCELGLTSFVSSPNGRPPAGLITRGIRIRRSPAIPWTRDPPSRRASRRSTPLTPSPQRS